MRILFSLGRYVTECSCFNQTWCGNHPAYVAKLAIKKNSTGMNNISTGTVLGVVGLAKGGWV